MILPRLDTQPKTDNMHYPLTFTTLGLILIAYGLVNGGWFLLAVWLGGDFLALGAAHQFGFHRLYGKRYNGRLAAWSWPLFLPLHLLTRGLWYLLRLRRVPSTSVISDDLVVGRRLLPGEVDAEFTNYVDLTSEFAAPTEIRLLPAYRCFPILDGSAPRPDAMRAFIDNLRPGRTYVHCAQGHGRTGLFASAYLIARGTAGSIDEGLQTLQAVRPGVRLNGRQRECLVKFAEIAR